MTCVLSASSEPLRAREKTQNHLVHTQSLSLDFPVPGIVIGKVPAWAWLWSRLWRGQGAGAVQGEEHPLSVEPHRKGPSQLHRRQCSISMMGRHPFRCEVNVHVIFRSKAPATSREGLEGNVPRPCGATRLIHSRPRGLPVGPHMALRGLSGFGHWLI